MPRILLAAVVLAVSAACAGQPPPSVEGSGAELARLNAAVAEVAAAQADADPLLAEHLSALHGFDAIIEELRDPEQVDAAKDRWGPVDEDLDVVDAAGLREAYREVAFAVDDARSVLANAREDATDGWESDYLDAQDDVLEAVREHARAADALGQVIGEQWEEVYGDLREMTTTFVEQRWFYRTSEEAADAYELELKPHLEDLREARVLVARFAAERDDAAQEVNEATAVAAEIWASRPSETAGDDR